MELSKQKRLNYITNKLKKLKDDGIVDRDTVLKFGRIGVESPEIKEQRQKLKDLAESLLESSTIEEVIEKREKSGLFPRSGSIIIDRIKTMGLDYVKMAAKDTIQQFNNEELFFGVFKLGLEGELTREDIATIINDALGENNGNN